MVQAGAPKSGFISFFLMYVVYAAMTLMSARMDHDWIFRSPTLTEDFINASVVVAFFGSIVLSVVITVIICIEKSSRRWGWFCAAPLFLHALFFAMMAALTYV